MTDITQIGTGAGGGIIGGFLGWLISHLKHREIKEDIAQRVHKETCLSERVAIHDKFDFMCKKMDKMDEKLDRLIERM